MFNIWPRSDFCTDSSGCIDILKWSIWLLSYHRISAVRTNPTSVLSCNLIFFYCRWRSSVPMWEFQWTASSPWRTTIQKSTSTTTWTRWSWAPWNRSSTTEKTASTSTRVSLNPLTDTSERSLKRSISGRQNNDLQDLQWDLVHEFITFSFFFKAS